MGKLIKNLNFVNADSEKLRISVIVILLISDLINGSLASSLIR